MEERYVIQKGLTKIGNQKPYFSITCNKMWGKRCVAFGCLHDEILIHYPDLKDFVDMHLSDIDGVPMHAIENGWYWLASTMPDGYAQYTHANKKEAFDFFCKHCRITHKEGKEIKKRINYALRDSDIDISYKITAKAKWVEICESMKPRWKREAEALIRKYHLKVQQE